MESQNAIPSKLTANDLVEGEFNGSAISSINNFITCEPPYNMLTLYGETGVGKTRLLSFAKDIALKHNPNSVVIEKSCSQFVNDICLSVSNGQVQTLIGNYAEADYIFLDDASYLVDKEYSQGVLLSILKLLSKSHKKVMITFNASPKLMFFISPQLASLLKGGLSIVLGCPESQAKQQIIQQYAQQSGQAIPDSVAQLIATTCGGDIRVLRGLVNNLLHTSTTRKLSLSLELARDVMDEFFALPIQSKAN